MTLKKTLFLDRDGIINIDKNYVHKIADFELVPGILDCLRSATKNGYQLIIITNQSGIRRRLYTESAYQLFTDHMISVFRDHDIEFEGIYHCPHIYQDLCECRKPKPGLFNQAIEEHQVDIATSWVIGDKKRDIQAAEAAGIESSILIEANDLMKLHTLKVPFMV